MNQDLSDIDRFVAKHLVKTKYTTRVEEYDYPFSFERLLLWLLDNPGIEFVFQAERQPTLHLSREENAPKNTLLFILFYNYKYATKIAVQLKDTDLRNEESLRAWVDKTKLDYDGFPYSLSKLRAFFLGGETSRQLAEKRYFDSALDFIQDLYPEFLVKAQKFKPQSLESGTVAIHKIELQTSEERNWTNPEIGNLYLEIDNIADLLGKEMPWTEEFTDYGVRLLSVKASIVHNPRYGSLHLYFDVELEIYSQEHYWETIGYHKTRLEGFCSGRFDESGLFAMAEEWGVEAESKEELCTTLLEAIKELDWDDWKLILEA